MKSKYANIGIENGNYKDGNRMSGNFICPECGKDRICEKRNAWRVCRNCKQVGIKNQRWLGGKRSYHRNIARQVMTKHLGRELLSTEDVHHLDHNFTNNNIENLYLFNSRGEHIHYHRMKESWIRALLCQEGETCIRQ